MHDLALLPGPAHRGRTVGFPETFLVDPYDLDGTAERLGAAIAMPEPSRQGRMTRLRERVLEWNINRWAGEMLGTVPRLPDPEVIS